MAEPRRELAIGAPVMETGRHASQVHLTAEHGEPDSLTGCRDDQAIVEAIGQALWGDARLRTLDDGDISADVHCGMVVLRGHTTGPENTLRAERATRTVPGVLGVENRIVTDGALAMLVAQALALDESTRGKLVYVHARHGVIYLSSAAGSADLRAAAEACAARIPLVRGIVNDIPAPDMAPDADAQRVLQPGIGQEIYTPALRLGRVERVIISQHHRRVTEFVARGHFPARTDDGGSIQPDPPRLERWVVIPIGAVRAVTASAVVLHISGMEATRYAIFDPAAFVTPAASWQPPYPYRTGDVLVSRQTHVQE
jgi:osmotically-inducible protein OsmY